MSQLLKLVPGLAMLGLSFGILMAGYAWPWGWAIGVVLLCIGIATMGKKKSDNYNF
jgi:hypothetical protein